MFERGGVYYKTEISHIYYTAEVSSIIRGHHVYTSVWSSTVGETLNTKPDNREESKDYDKFAIGVYKEDLLVGHIATNSNIKFMLSLSEQ